MKGYIISIKDTQWLSKIAISVLLLLIATNMMWFLSETSPRYDLTPHVDPCVFFAMGKFWANGYVLYIDFFDHKGPHLFAINRLAYYMSPTTLTGVYIIIVAHVWTILCLCYAIARFFAGKGISLLASVTAVYFMQISGAQSELYCLAYILIPIYFVFRWNFAQTRQNTHYLLFSVGLTFTLLFFTKFNWGLTVLPIAAVAWGFLFFEKKKVPWCEIGVFALGLFPVTIFYTTWLLIDGAFVGMLQEYLWYNIKYGSSSQDPGRGTISFHAHRFIKFLLPHSKYIIHIIGLFLLTHIILRIHWRTVCCLIGFTMGLALATYGSRSWFDFYLMPFSIIICLNVLLIGIVVLRSTQLPMWACILLAVLVTLQSVNDGNTSDLDFVKGSDPAKWSAHRRNFDEVGKRIKWGSTLLTVNWMDSGYGIPLHVMPPVGCKYFFQPGAASPSITEAQMDCIRARNVQYVLINPLECDEQERILLDSGYRLIYDADPEHKLKGPFYFERTRLYELTNDE